MGRNRCVVAVALMLAVATSARAQERRITHPGYVSSAPFLEFSDDVGDDGTVVEISIRGELLRAVAKGLAASDPEVARLIGRLVAVNAVIVEVEDEDRRDSARRLVRDTHARLLRQGWEPLARVRERDAAVHVLVRSDGDDGEVLGLTVMVVDTGAASGQRPQLIFANIAGVLDLAQIGRIGQGLKLPGLDRIEEDGAAARARPRGR